MKTDQCSSCSHAVVCPHQQALSEAQKAVDLALSSKDLTFIKTVSVECKHYSSKMNTRGELNK